MNSQEQKPARWDPLEPIRRALIPFLSPSDTIRVIGVFSNLPQWMGCVFTSLFLVWFRRTWYVATTEQNIYFAKWGFGKIDSTSILRIPRKDVQLKGNDLIFTVPNEPKPRKLYSVLLGGDARFKEDLLNPGNAIVNQSSNLIQEVAGGSQPVSQPDQTSQKTCPQCAEKIQLEALVCRFCGHQFAESDVQALKQQVEEQNREAQRLANERAQEARRLAEEQASFREIEAKTKSRRTWGWILSILGGLLSSVGCLIFLLFVIAQFSSSSTTSENTTGFIGALFICPLPLLVVGLLMFGRGVYTLRAIQKEAKESIQPHPIG